MRSVPYVEPRRMWCVFMGCVSSRVSDNPLAISDYAHVAVAIKFQHFICRHSANLVDWEILTRKVGWSNHILSASERITLLASLLFSTVRKCVVLVISSGRATGAAIIGKAGHARVVKVERAASAKLLLPPLTAANHRIHQPGYPLLFPLFCYWPNLDTS